MAGLLIKNFLRFLGEQWFPWAMLAFTYLATFWILFDSVMEKVLRYEALGFVFLPLILEKLPLPAVRLKGFGTGLVGLYLRQEFRRGNLWLTLLIAVVVGSFALSAHFVFWLLVAQFSVQRALYSVQIWRRATMSGSGRPLWDAFVSSQLLQYAIVWLALPLTMGGSLEFRDWWLLGYTGLGAVLGAACVVLEGDSGRPWLVNLISWSVGIFAGLVCFYSPWVLLVVFYFASRMRILSENRMKSVENFYDDALIS